MKVATTFFLGGFVGLATITNPLSKIPLFLSLAAGMASSARAMRPAGPASMRWSCCLPSSSQASPCWKPSGFLRGAAHRRWHHRRADRPPHALRYGRHLAAGVARGERRLLSAGDAGYRRAGAIATVIGISTEIAELPSGGVRASAYTATVLSIVATCRHARHLPLGPPRFALAGQRGHQRHFPPDRLPARLHRRPVRRFGRAQFSRRRLSPAFHPSVKQTTWRHHE